MSKIISPTLTGQCISEFLGTTLLVFFGSSSVAATRIAGAQLDLWEISIIWGFGITLAIYLTASISGAHLNPAITITFWLFNHFDKKKVLPYIIAQMIGGFVAAALVYWMYFDLFIEYEKIHQIIRGSQESLFTAGIFSTYPINQISILQAFMVEVVIAIILVCMIFSLTDNNNGIHSGPLAPLLIGIMIAVIGGSFGSLTGFALNPARDFGPKLIAYFSGWGNLALTGGNKFPYFIIPLTAPFVGAIIGAFIYHKLIGYYLPMKINRNKDNI